MDREAPADPLAQDAIEQERLIAVDEHHEEVEGEGSEGADEILRTSRQTVQDRLLEPVGPRVAPQRLLAVSGVAECGPDRVCFRVFPFQRLRAVRPAPLTLIGAPAATP